MQHPIDIVRPGQRNGGGQCNPGAAIDQQLREPLFAVERSLVQCRQAGRIDGFCIRSEIEKGGE